MRRNALIKLIPATTFISGQTYIACLHGNMKNQSVVVLCEEQSYQDDNSKEVDAYDCRFQNGNIYPFLKTELFVFVAEYEVASLANPRKSVGNNTIDLDWSDYTHMANGIVVNTPNRVEVFIDFDNNKAKVLTNEKSFNVKEVIALLENIKSNDTGELSSMGEFIWNSTFDGRIEAKIQEIKNKYQW